MCYLQFCLQNITFGIFFGDFLIPPILWFFCPNSIFNWFHPMYFHFYYKNVFCLMFHLRSLWTTESSLKSFFRPAGAMEEALPCFQWSPVCSRTGSILLIKRFSSRTRMDCGAETKSLVSFPNTPVLNPKSLRSADDTNVYVLLTVMYRWYWGI